MINSIIWEKVLFVCKQELIEPQNRQSNEKVKVIWDFRIHRGKHLPYNILDLKIVDEKGKKFWIVEQYLETVAEKRKNWKNTYHKI